MNKKVLATAMVVMGLFPSLLFAQLYRMEVDAQESGSQKVIDRVFTGNTVGLQVSFFDGGSPLSMTNWYTRFLYGYGQYDTNGMIPVVGSAGASNNIVVFESATNVFFSENGNYYFSIVGTNADGKVRTFARGRMIEEYDPATGGSYSNVIPMPWANLNFASKEWIVDYISTNEFETVVSYGTNSTSAYRGDNGAAASNLAASAYLLASNAVSTNYAGDLSILGHVDLYSEDARPAINYSTYVPSTSEYDIAVFLNKQLTNSGTTAMYGIIDSADINRPGNAQYHSHSTHNKFTGTNGYSEIVGYENAQAYYSSGNLQYGYGFRSWPRLEAGTVGSYYGFCARDPRLTDGSPPGVVSNNYAFYAGEQLRGVTNWAFYSAGATPSRFGGIALGTNAVVTNWPASDGISAVTATSIAETVVGTWVDGVTVQINGDLQSLNDSPSFTIPTNFTTAAAAGQIATNVASGYLPLSGYAGLVVLGTRTRGYAARTNLGDYGFAAGQDTSAGNYGFAAGFATSAGYAGFAAGQDTSAGNYGFAAGFATSAGYAGFAAGQGTGAGDNGFAAGYRTSAGEYGFAAGEGTTAGYAGFAAGDGTSAGNYGFASGRAAKGAYGSFVFADSAGGMPFNRTNYPNSFSLRVAGGIYAEIGTNVFAVSNAVTMNGVELGAGGGSGISAAEAGQIATNVATSYGFAPTGSVQAIAGAAAAALADGIHPRLTAVTNDAGAAYIWPASSAWWRVYGENAITGIVAVTDGATITGADALFLGVEVQRTAADFSWGGGSAPMASVTNAVPAGQISLHGLWRPSGGTNWTGF